MRSLALVAVLALVAPLTARGDPDLQLGRSDKGRRWQIGQGTETVLIAVDAKARAASWDTSFRDDAVAEARQERDEELGGGIALAGAALVALGFSMVSHHPGAGLTLALGGWLSLDAGTLVYANAQPDSFGNGRRRHHHR